MPVSNKKYFVQKFLITLILSPSLPILLPQKVCMRAAQTYTMRNIYVGLCLLSSSWPLCHCEQQPDKERLYNFKAQSLSSEEKHM